MRPPPLVLLAALGCACHSDPSVTQLETLRARAEASPATHRVIAPQQAQHEGPAVAQGLEGPARFAAILLGDFDAARAMALVTLADGYYREPGNDGFEAVLDRLEQELRAAGYGSEDGFELEVLRTPQSTPAWTPLAARLALHTRDGERELLEFHEPGGAARTMLPRNAPSAEVEGPLVFKSEDVNKGCVLVLERPASRAQLEQARAEGAVAVLAAGLEDYNVDPTGAERHLDAIQYGRVPHPCPLPTARISARVHGQLLQAQVDDPAVRVSLKAQVRFDERELRTLVATVKGSGRPNEAVVVAAHVQEPGACDNASGLAALCEEAIVVARALRAGKLERPLRSLVFVWGLEHTESRLFLEHTPLHVIAGISADMLGESSAQTGAVALLERLPDPGAVKVLPPDRHTAWGSREVAAEELPPGGLATVARCALLDVAALDGNWRTSEHPYEGGSDHDEFLRKEIPGVLFWHFPDFAYHTSLDRLAHVDPAELKRMGTAVGACALALADAQPRDLDRYLTSLLLELDLRLGAAADARDEGLMKLWHDWGTGARLWLRRLCLPDAPEPPAR